MTGGRKVPPSNALGLLLHHPELAGAFLTFSTQIARSTLPRRTRELAILRVAWRRGCRYEWAQHVRSGVRHGLTEQDLEEVRSGAPTLVNRAVDELETDSRLSDATCAELSKELDTRQLMDLVFTIGAYALMATAFNTFDVRLDEDLPDGGFDREAEAS
jgi:AhpD family alkylhydroperoxidase